MIELIFTSEDVAKTVLDDLNRQGLKLASVARKLGKSPQNFYNMLKGRNRFSKRTAELLHDEFGYSIRFLTEGKGSLREYVESESFDLSSLPSFIEDDSSLSEREKILNAYSAAYIQIYLIIDKITQDIPGRVPTTYSITADINRSSAIMKTLNDAGLSPQNARENDILSRLLVTYANILSVIDPSHIINDLNQIDPEKKY